MNVFVRHMFVYVYKYNLESVCSYLRNTLFFGLHDLMNIEGGEAPSKDVIDHLRKGILFVHFQVWFLFNQ